MTLVRAQFAGDGRSSTRTREDIIQALRDYAEVYGPAFTTAAFNPSTAKWRDEPEMVERYYAGNPLRKGAPWPSLNAIKSYFDGSFNAAREAAGLEPNKPGPTARRAAHKHAPIRDVRERRVVMPSDRQVELVRQLRRAQDRLARVEPRLIAERDRADRAEAKFATVRERSLSLREAGAVEAKPVTKVKTKTVTKTVTKKVRDERALERLRSKLEDERAAHRATTDQLKALNRDFAKRGEALDAAQDRLDELLADMSGAVCERDRAVDRLTVFEARVDRLAGELEDRRERELGMNEAAAASELVRAAEDRAEAADLRAARLEREMAEQAAAITGELRRLTAAELAKLRKAGPAGPAVLAKALDELRRARSKQGDLDGALVAVARAAINWRDRERR